MGNRQAAGAEPPDPLKTASGPRRQAAIRGVEGGTNPGLKPGAWSPKPLALCQLQPLVVPQLVHLWQLPLGIMIDPHSGQVGASLRAMKLKLPLPLPFL